MPARSKTFLRPITAAAALLLTFSSVPETVAAAQKKSATKAPSAKYANVRVVHAIPNAGTVDVYVGSRKLLPKVAYKSVSRYLTLPGGTQTIKIVRTASPDTPLLEIPITVKTGRSYTAAAVGTVGTARSVLVEDDPPAAVRGKALLRVVHLAPDAPPIDVYAVKPTETRLVKSLAYGKAAAFVPLSGGSYTLEARPTGNPFSIAQNISLKVSGGTPVTAFALGLLKEEPPKSFTLLLAPNK